ncbi:hypothetical protein [Desulfocicer niacini]
MDTFIEGKPSKRIFQRIYFSIMLWFVGRAIQTLRNLLYKLYGLSRGIMMQVWIPLALIKLRLPRL